jgi:hypothetical protein
VPPKDLEGKDYTIRQGENGLMNVPDLKIMEVKPERESSLLTTYWSESTLSSR